MTNVITTTTMIFGAFEEEEVAPGCCTPDEEEPVDENPPPSPPSVAAFEEYCKKRKEQDERLRETPSFFVECFQEKAYDLLFDVFEDHRCRSCRCFLCCGGGVFHEVNCWSHELADKVDLVQIRNIHTYRIDAMLGCMKGWEEFTYEPFEEEKHVRNNFAPQYVGLYVRCFTCPRCTKIDSQRCHAAFHTH